jgi:solute carrier family 45, member 1/2/4
MTNGGVAPPAPLPRSQLASLAVGLVGLQVCWAVQVGYVTKTIVQLGLAARWTGVVWLAGPVAGIIVQPLVGVASDACTSRHGRRRPFIVAGTLVTMVALAGFAFARELGAAVGVAPLSVAVVSFWALDFAINAAQGPLRALMADLAPAEQQTEGNAYFAFATGVGNVAGGALGSLPLATILPVFANDGQALYVIAIFFVALCIAFLVSTVPETPVAPLAASSVVYSRVADDGQGQALEAAVASSAEYSLSTLAASSPLPRPPPSTGTLTHSSTFVQVFRAAPHPFLDVFAVQCFTWFAYFTFFIFAASYVGAEVFNGVGTAAPGSPPRNLYDEGVRLGNFAFALQALVSIAASLVVPRLVSRYSAQGVLFGSHVLLGTALASTLVLHAHSMRYVVVAGFALIGIPWAVTIAVPWGMASSAVLRASPERAGQYRELRAGYCTRAATLPSCVPPHRRRC